MRSIFNCCWLWLDDKHMLITEPLHLQPRGPLNHNLSSVQRDTKQPDGDAADTKRRCSLRHQIRKMLTFLHRLVSGYKLKLEATETFHQ